MAQLERVGAKRIAIKANPEVSGKALSVTAEILHDALEGPSRQQNELAGWYNDIAELLSGTVPVPAGRRAAQGPSNTEENHPLSCKRPLSL